MGLRRYRTLSRRRRQQGSCRRRKRRKKIFYRTRARRRRHRRHRLRSRRTCRPPRPLPHQVRQSETQRGIKKTPSTHPSLTIVLLLLLQFLVPCASYRVRIYAI